MMKQKKTDKYSDTSCNECTCSCDLLIEPQVGFQQDQNGKYLWKLKKNDTGLVEIICDLDTTSDTCFCSEDISDGNRIVKVKNLEIANFPGRFNSTVDNKGMNVEITAKVIGKAQLLIEVNELVAECREPGANESNLISSNKISCQSINREIQII